MARAFLFTLISLAAFTRDLSAQSPADQQPTEVEIAAYKRRVEILRHPTGVITIRLAALGREPATAPPPYTVDNWMHFQMFESQNSGGDLMCWDDRDPYYAYRPELIRDGDILSYTKQAQKLVERAELEPWGNGFTRAPSTMTSGKEYQSHYVKLEDWYESPLNPGRYQLIVRKQFLTGGDWVESNPVTFDVMPRKSASPIPDAFSLRVVPERPVKQTQGGQTLQLGYNDGLYVELVNDSDQRVLVSVIDKYYGHRPQLTKDGKAIPYSDEALKLIESKGKDARLIEVVNPIFLDPKTSSRLDGFSLKQWYGPPSPGVYHLTDRRRFEIDGPWTKDSAELVFEIVP